MPSPPVEVLLHDAQLTPTVHGALERLHELEEQVRLAQQVLQDLLPASPPSIAGLKAHTYYAPAGKISGDFYDIYRLDESHVAIALADATGHGIPAALLSIFIKRSMSGKEVVSNGYRLLEPAEVLEGLNRDMVNMQLSQCQFLAALYAVYDERTRILRWARGGSPYPIFIRPGQPLRQIKTEGPLVGVIDDAHFETNQIQLEAGDAIVFHTDGVDDLLTGGPDRTHDALHETNWFSRLGRVELSHHIAALNTLRNAASPRTRDLDDITLIALQATASMVSTSSYEDKSRPVLHAP